MFPRRIGSFLRRGGGEEDLSPCDGGSVRVCRGPGFYLSHAKKGNTGQLRFMKKSLRERKRENVCIYIYIVCVQRAREQKHAGKGTHASMHHATAHSVDFARVSSSDRYEWYGTPAAPFTRRLKIGVDTPATLLGGTERARPWGRAARHTGHRRETIESI